MPALHIAVGWLAILAGLVVGTVLGLGFHREAWLGGYPSWRRRLLRLTHISLVGTGLLNLAFAFSVAQLDLAAPPRLASALLVLGAVAMPAVCALSAWRPALRHLFFIPVASLIVGVADFLWEGLLR
ncbi:MAG: hypothetical protein KBD01_17435 [Acidobacteria bacterium]|nr:hypothetical protein [Acidobacteriota bacterium]